MENLYDFGFEIEQRKKKKLQLPAKYVVNYKNDAAKNAAPPAMEEQQNTSQSCSSTNKNQQKKQAYSEKVISHIKKAYKHAYYRNIYLFVMIVFSISMVITSPDKGKVITKASCYVELGCHCTFLLLFIIRIFACQKIKVVFFLIQLISLISGISLFLVMDQQALKYIKVVRILRLLIFLDITCLKKPFKNLQKATKNLPKLIIPALFLIYIYSIIGLYTFQGNQFSRCRDVSNKEKSANWTLYQQAQYLCGQRQCPQVSGMQLQCLNPLDYEVQPDKKQVETEMFGYGLMRYDNILYSLLNTCKIIFITGWSRIAILEKQATNETFVKIYFLSFLYLVSYVYMTIIYGLMMSNEKENNPKKVSYIQKCESINTDSNMLQTTKSVQKEEQKKFNNYLLVIEKRALELSQKQIMEEDDLEKDKCEGEQSEEDQETKIKRKGMICLHRHYYLPDCKKFKKCYFKMAGIYHIINIIFIMNACLNLAIEFNDQSYQITRIRGIIDFICFAQFSLHIVGMLIIYKIKEVNLKQWWIDNDLIPLKNFQQIPIIFKAQIFLLFLCIAGIILQIIFADNFERILVPQLKQQKILRTFKYWRILFIFINSRYFKETKNIILSTKRAVQYTLPFTVVYFLFLFIFSLIGYSLFSENTTQIKSISFDSVFQSFIFVSLTFYNEQWDYNMFQLYPQKGISIVIFQFITVAVGILIFSKYYLAILMKYLGDQLDYLSEGSKKEDFGCTNKVQNQFKEQEKQIPEEVKIDEIRKKKRESVLQKFNFKKETDSFKNNSVVPLNTHCESESPSLMLKKNKLLKQRNENLNNLNFIFNQKNPSEDILSEIEIPDSKNSNRTNDQKVQKKGEQNKQKQYVQDTEEQQEDKFALLGQHCQKVFTSNVYIAIFSLMIFLTLVQVAIRDPLLDPNSQIFIIFGYIQKITNSLFLVDLIINILVFGLFKNNTSYLKRRKTNILNIIITLLCIPAIFPSLSNMFVVYKIGKLKVMRLCILIDIFSSKSVNMRFTVISFTKLLPKLIKLLFIVCIFYGFFAISMVKLYANQFFYCQGYEESVSIKTKQDCLNWGGNWIEYEFNTNNSLSSLLYLLMIASTQGWISLMIPMANIRGKDLQPQINANGFVRIFFLFFFFFGNMIILNIFTGLSIQTMKDIRKEQSGQSILTKDQKDWLLIRERIFRIELHPKIIPEEKTCKYYFYIVANHKGYQFFKIAFMIVYLIGMSIKYNDPDLVIQVQSIFAIFSVITFVIEYVGYIKKKKPFITVFNILFTVYFIIFKIMYYSTDHLKDMKTFKIAGATLICFQLFRYWTFICQLKFVRKTLKFLNIIIPHVAYTMALMGTILILYSFLGVELFSYLKNNSQLEDYNQNYRNFFMSIFTLIKFSTWEAPIQQISNAGMELSPHFICHQVKNYEQYMQYGLNGCGSKTKSYIFFMTFHILYSIILMSSFIATIFDGYCEVKKQQEQLINEFQLEEVTDQWLNYDPEAKGFLAYHNFWRFVSKLHQIYQLSQEKIISTENKSSFLSKLNIPVYSDDTTLGFQFYQTIQGLTRIMLNKKYGKEIRTSRPDQIFRARHSLHRSEYQIRNFTSQHVFIIILLRQGLRQWKNKSNNVFIPGIFNNVFFKVN